MGKLVDHRAIVLLGIINIKKLNALREYLAGFDRCYFAAI